MSVYRSRYVCIREYTGVDMSVYRNMSVYRSMQEYTGVFMSVYGSMSVYRF